MSDKYEDNVLKLALNTQMLDEYSHLTIKEYFKLLLLKLWEEGEGFSGKRPLGNSGWEYDLYIPLGKANFFKAKLDEDDCLEDFDVKSANKLINNMIKYCFEDKL